MNVVKLEKKRPSYEELERKCQRQAVKIKGLRKALKNIEKKHGYAKLREEADVISKIEEFFMVKLFGGLTHDDLS